MKEAKILEGVNEKARNYLKSIFVVRNFFTGETIITEGEQGNELFIIKDGKVEILVDGVKIVELVDGDAFGEMALIDEQTRSATVKVIEDATVYALNIEAFNKLKEYDISAYAAIIYNIAKQMSERLRSVNSKINKIWKWYIADTL